MKKNRFLNFIFNNTGKVSLAGVVILWLAFPVTDYYHLHGVVVPLYIGGILLYLIGLYRWRAK